MFNSPNSPSNASQQHQRLVTRKMATENDFTKQRDWVQIILQGIPDFLHVLSADGKIIYVSNSCWRITGYETAHLLGRFINDFIHPDDIVLFIQEFNASILNFQRTRFIYRFRKSDGSWIVLESNFGPFFRHMLVQNEFTQSNLGQLDTIVMARPYLSKGGALFDSFLEQQIEHERLIRSMEKLKQERLESRMAWRTPENSPQGQYGGTSPTTNQHSRGRTGAMTGTNDQDEGFVIDTTEETSSVTVGDLGIPILKKRKERKIPIRSKRPKNQDPEPKLCVSCGTFNSPEWRKGPMGPKTLCNACGCKCMYCNFTSIANKKWQYDGQKEQRERMKKPCNKCKADIRRVVACPFVQFDLFPGGWISISLSRALFVSIS